MVVHVKINMLLGHWFQYISQHFFHKLNVSVDEDGSLVAKKSLSKGLQTPFWSYLRGIYEGDRSVIRMMVILVIERGRFEVYMYVEIVKTSRPTHYRATCNTKYNFSLAISSKP